MIVATEILGLVFFLNLTVCSFEVGFAAYFEVTEQLVLPWAH